MRFNSKLWVRRSFKVGTLPKLHYFVRRADVARLAVGQMLKIRIDDGTTKPDYQHDTGVLIDELRDISGEVMYVAEKF